MGKQLSWGRMTTKNILAKQVHPKLKKIFENDAVAQQELQFADYFTKELQKIKHEYSNANPLTQDILRNYYTKEEPIPYYMFNYSTLDKFQAGYAAEKDLTEMLWKSAERLNIENVRRSGAEPMSPMSAHNVKLASLADDFVDDVLQSLSKEFKKNFEDTLQLNNKQMLNVISSARSERSRKTDITFSISPSSELAQTFNEIKKFNFTVKNTTSNYYKFTAYLGHTNMFKIYLNLIPSLGFDNKQAINLAYRVYTYRNLLYVNGDKEDNRQSTDGNIVLTHDTHIRYTYELTGQGARVRLKGGDGIEEFANFILFNTPNSIYCFSTRDLLRKVILQQNDNYVLSRKKINATEDEITLQANFSGFHMNI